MSNLGKDYFEIGRGFKKINKNYSRIYLFGVNIKNIDKPFVLAIGGFHADSCAIVLNIEELINARYNEHIRICKSEGFVENLKKALKNKEKFPFEFILKIIEENCTEQSINENKT